MGDTMDAVLTKLETALICDDEPNVYKTRFDAMYKNWGRLGFQEERRRQLLENQKSDRHLKLDRFRGILELLNAEEEETFNEQKAYYKPRVYVPGFHTSRLYKNTLMLSEWMIEKPKDFHENWYVSPCPKGVRTLVVSSRGITKCYSRYGQFLFECRTALPGSNTSDPRHRNQCCVLDCFYLESSRTMYIADLLAWNHQPMTDGETEFRHYWMQTELNTIEELKVISKKNKLIFTLLPKVECSPESFNKFMMKCPHFENFTPMLDGLLFYHKKGHYVAGQTPLVGWLYPYMVPEVLGRDITVNPVYIAEKPIDYTGQAEFILKFDAKHAKTKTRSLRNTIDKFSMDTADVIDGNETVKPYRKTKKRSTLMESETADQGNAQLMESEATPLEN